MQDRGFGGDVDRVGDGAEFELDIDGEAFVGTDGEVIAEVAFEAGAFGGEAVGAGGEEGEGIETVRGGDGFVFGLGRNLGGEDLNAGDAGILRVGDASADGGAEFLRGKEGSEQE